MHISQIIISAISLYCISNIVHAAIIHRDDQHPIFKNGEKLQWTVDLSAYYPFGVYCSRMEAYFAPAFTSTPISSDSLNEFVNNLRRSILKFGFHRPPARENHRLIWEALRSQDKSSKDLLQMIAATGTTDPLYGDGEARVQVELGTRYQVKWTVRRRQQFGELKLFRLHLACVRAREPSYPVMQDLDLRWFFSPPMDRQLVASSEPFRIIDRGAVQHSSVTSQGLSQFGVGNEIHDLTPPEIYLRDLGHSAEQSQSLETLLEELMLINNSNNNDNNAYDRSRSSKIDEESKNRLKQIADNRDLEFPTGQQWLSINKQLRAKLRRFRNLHSKLRSVHPGRIEILADESGLKTETIYGPSDAIYSTGKTVSTTTTTTTIAAAAASAASTTTAGDNNYLDREASTSTAASFNLQRVCSIKRLSPVEFNSEALRRVIDLMAMRHTHKSMGNDLAVLQKYQSIFVALKTFMRRLVVGGSTGLAGNLIAKRFMGRQTNILSSHYSRSIAATTVSPARNSLGAIGAGVMALYFGLLSRQAYLQYRQRQLGNIATDNNHRDQTDPIVSELIDQHRRLKREIEELSAENRRYFAVQTVRSLCRLMNRQQDNQPRHSDNYYDVNDGDGDGETSAR